MPVAVKIWLLGGFRVELGERPLPAATWRRSKAKAVVKLLALAPGHRLHREQLVDQLWPEHDPDKAAANLRKAVHFARQALTADSLAADDGGLRLVGEPLWVDVDAFEALARAGNAEDAVAVYGGELLPEDLFEPWTEPRREQLGLRFARLVLDWAIELDRSGRDREAADALERLIAADPLNEEAHVQLMRLHAFAGRSHLAVQWYHQLEARLADELGVRPSAPARSLYEGVVAGRLAQAPAVVPGNTADASPAVAVLPRRAERKLSTLLVLDGVAADDDVVAVLRSWGAAVLREDGAPTVAVFGSPRALEDHAVRALRAALEIVGQVSGATSIGVATGEVVVEAGPAPGDDRVLGGAVELARRLSGAARPGTVFVHERTYRSTGELFDYAPVRRLRPRAGEEPLVARELVAERPAAGLATRRPERAMVGREAELAAVLSLAADVVDSARPRVVLVQGPAGIGKSRLVQEAVESIASQHPTTRVLQGRCRSAGRAVTYWALAEVVRQACGIAFDAPVQVAREAMSRGLREVLSPLQLTPAELDATVFALAATAGIDLPGSPLDRAQPKEVAEELARAWPRFTTACAAAGPAVLVVEDLHWADDALLEMVHRIGMRSDGRLLVLCTARTELGESHPGFGSAGEHVSTVSLRPLTGTASHELLEQLAARAPVPVDRRTEIVSKAEGNPFFLEQLVAHVAEGGAGSLPDSVLSVLAARIDALPDIEKAVVQQAAVVGRVFWSEPVSRSLDNVDVSGALQSLERRGLVLTRPTSSLGDELELAFAHALVRDVAYGSIPGGRRSVAHEHVGTWLEERASGRRDELAELLAYHFVTAVDYAGTDASDGGRRECLRRKAFDHLMVAGVAARRRFAVPRAVELHHDALTHAVGDDERLRAFEAVGDDLESAFQGHEAMAAYLAALDIARANPTLGRSRSRLCRKLAGLMAHTPGAFRVSPDPAYVEQLVDEGLEFVDDDDVGRARLLLVRGACARLWQGSEPFGTIRGPGPDPIPIDERIEAATEALRIGGASGEPELVSAANDVLVVLLGVVGRYDLMLERAREQLESLADAPRLTQADVTRKVAVLAIEVEGKLVEGAELARAAYELSQGSNPHQLMHTTYPLLVSLYHLGRWSELMGLLDEHLAAFGQDPALFCQFVRDGPVIGAIVHTHLGDFERARDVAALVPDPQQDPETASAWQSRLAVLRGQPAVARDLSGPKALERRTYGPQHALAVVEALTALEDWAALRDFLPRAREAVAGNALLAPFCDRALALAEADAGHTTLAIAGLQRALDRFEELGVVLEVARTQQALAPLVSAAERDRLLDAAAAAYDVLGVVVQPAGSSPAEGIG